MHKASCIIFIVGWLAFAPAQSQSIKIMKLVQLEQLLNKTDDTLRVINFWATWCAPCVKEIPYFENARQMYASQKVSVVLVSLDDIKDLETKVKPFVSNRKIRSKVLLLDEPDANTWIDKVAPEWSGALPMTLIVNKARTIRHYIGKPVNQAELTSLINQHKL